MTLGAGESQEGTSVLSASAGPRPIWMFRFSPQGSLEELTVFVDHLVRYTPYRLDFGETRDWSISPAQLLVWLGAPDTLAGADSGSGVVMSWNRGQHRLSFEFGSPYSPSPNRSDQQALMVRVVSLTDISH